VASRSACSSTKPTAPGPSTSFQTTKTSSVQHSRCRRGTEARLASSGNGCRTSLENTPVTTRTSSPSWHWRRAP
jgi:hypothetical protein